MNNKPKYFSLGKKISYPLSILFKPPENPNLNQIYTKFSFITFGNRIRFPGYGFWLSRESIKSAGFYIDINPNLISLEAKHGEVPFIDGSNWENGTKKFEKHSVISEMLVEGKKWQHTKQFKLMISQVNSGKAAYGCRTVEEVEEYYLKMEDSWDSIKSNGYEKQGFTDPLSLYPDDILVSLGRDGRIYLERNGTHRLTLAQLLNINEISVYVIRIHPELLVKNEFNLNNLF